MQIYTYSYVNSREINMQQAWTWRRNEILDEGRELKAANLLSTHETLHYTATLIKTRLPLLRFNDCIQMIVPW